MPLVTGTQEVEFFKLEKYVSEDELEKEYAARGLEAASPFVIFATEQDKLDKMEYVGAHWKDAKGNWCCATFCRWDVEREVVVDRRDGWDGRWWFAGVRKSVLGTSETELSSSESLTLESAVKICKEAGYQVSKIL